jgi:hypothetical protein
MALPVAGRFLSDVQIHEIGGAFLKACETVDDRLRQGTLVPSDVARTDAVP